MIPAAVLHQIAERTGLDPRTGRRARAGACHRCHTPVLRGLDEDMCAFTAAADPHRLTGVGELLALAAGRDTYTLGGRPPQLLIRDRWRIRSQPATHVVVVAEHTCGTPRLPAQQNNEQQATATRENDANPPF